MTNFDVMRRVWVTLVAAAVVLAGCSSTVEKGGAPQPTVPGVTLPPSQQVPPTGPTQQPPPAGLSPTPGDKTPKVVNVTGTVREGTEPGCLLLDDYLLTNAPTSLVYAGVRVKLTLELQPDMATTCMQGTPATITSAQRIS